MTTKLPAFASATPAGAFSLSAPRLALLACLRAPADEAPAPCALSTLATAPAIARVPLRVDGFGHRESLAGERVIFPAPGPLLGGGHYLTHPQVTHDIFTEYDARLHASTFNGMRG